MKKVDLIIPTYNRPDLLKRILDYYQEFGEDFNYIVADSSSKSNKKANRKIVDTHSKINILYIDKFSENTPQHIKFAEIVKYARNKYTCLCPDDDFIIPKGINDCVDFLEKNPDYVAAHGTYIGYYIHTNFLKQKEFWWKFRYSQHSIASSSPLERLSSHLNDFTLLVWAVRRTDMVQKCYREFLKTKIDPYLLIIFGELLPDVLTVILGKVKRVNTFYAARQYFNSIAHDFASLTDAKNASRYDEEYAKFKNCLLANLIKLSIPRDEATEVIDKAMEKYIKYSYQEHLTNKLYFKLRKFPKIINTVQLLHTIYLFSKKKIDPIGLIDRPQSKYFQNFKEIREFVLKYS